MATPLAIAFITTAVISAGSSIAGGFAANKASKREAGLLDDQSRLAQSEAAAEAQRVANQNRKFLKRQKLAFIKAGVTLDDSPLFVLEETLKEGQEEVTAISRRGGARARVFAGRAEQTRGQGRAALISGFGNAASSAFNSFGLGRTAGIF